jgi:hypothetical protein
MAVGLAVGRLTTTTARRCQVCGVKIGGGGRRSLLRVQHYALKTKTMQPGKIKDTTLKCLMIA